MSYLSPNLVSKCAGIFETIPITSCRDHLAVIISILTSKTIFDMIGSGKIKFNHCILHMYMYFLFGHEKLFTKTNVSMYFTILQLKLGYPDQSFRHTCLGHVRRKD